MLGVNGRPADQAVTVAKQVIKVVNKKALTSLVSNFRKVLKNFGVNLTKGGLAKGMGK